MVRRILSIVIFVGMGLGMMSSPAHAAAGACSACGGNIAGTWHYYAQDTTNMIIIDKTITLAQSKIRFSGTDGSYRWDGSIHGSTIMGTLVVDGEETEGYVLWFEGSIHGNQLYTFFHDSHGVSGSLTGNRI